VGGTAYYAGKKGQEAAEREAYEDARLDELEPQGQPASASVAAAPDTDALDKLAKLHEEGALTDEEHGGEERNPRALTPEHTGRRQTWQSDRCSCWC
jgi:hypothetical protein